MLDTLFNKLNVSGFARVLDAYAARQKAIAENIANVSTPGYQAKDVDFAKMLQERGDQNDLTGLRTEERHIPLGGESPSANPTWVTDESQNLMSGENNVDIDQEMAKSAANQLYYMATSKLVAAKFKALQMVIRGRV